MSGQRQPPTEAPNVAARGAQTAAIGIEEHIEQVLIEHTYVAGDNNVPAECTSSACLWKGWFLGDWRRHVASVLVAELGLTEEWCARHESGGGGIYTDYDDARRFLDRFVERPPGVEDPGSGRYVGLERRYVTSWEPA